MEEIYGISSKFEFGGWQHVVYVFNQVSIATEWLSTEEYDFRERELMTKEQACQLAGHRHVENALAW